MWRDVPTPASRPEALLRGAIALLFAALAVSAAGHALLGADATALAGLLPPCPFHALTGIDCPGCGMARALLALSQLRLGDALAAHPVSPFLLAAMGLWLVRGQPPAGRHTNRLAWVALALVLAVWLARVLPA